LNRPAHLVREFNPDRKRNPTMTVMVSVNTSKQVVDADHVYVLISFMKMNRNSMRCFAFSHKQPLRAGPVERTLGT
jgi:tRNA U54 and U55 pseudouridine synthase Pus10